MAKQKASNDTDSIAVQLDDIKRLLILALLRDGARQSEIAAALRVGQATVSRMFPEGIGKAMRSSRNSRN